METIVLVGAPNVGKSVLFNALTKGSAAVANYPGTTVDCTVGYYRSGGRAYRVIDTPGIYSLDAFSEDEAVTRRLLAQTKADWIVHVVDMKQLERMLPLTLRLLEAGLPVVLTLNLADEARRLGVEVDVHVLERQLGIPVVCTAALRGVGLDALRNVVAVRAGKAARRFVCPTDTEEKRCARMVRAQEIAVGATAARRGVPVRIESRIERLLREPLSGGLILAAVLYVGLYQIVGVFGAGVLVDVLQDGLARFVTPAVEQWTLWLPEPWRAFVAGPYGLYSMGARYAVGIVLPIVAVFFFVFALLEDSGYLPRMALLLNALFARIGLNGRAVIPVVLGLGCGTMAVMVTRVMETRRERVLLSFLLALAVPCSAQLGILLSLLSAYPAALSLWCAYLLGVFFAAGKFGHWLLRGEPTPFCLELPPLRRPLLKVALRKTRQKSWRYFCEVLPVFLITSTLLWALDQAGALAALLAAFAPCMAALGLPAGMADVFFCGFFRRDYGAAGLYDLCARGALSEGQMLVAAVFLTLCLPCVAQVVMLLKERGVRFTVATVLLTLTAAFASAFLLRFAARALF